MKTSDPFFVKIDMSQDGKTVLRKHLHEFRHKHIVGPLPSFTTAFNEAIISAYEEAPNKKELMDHVIYMMKQLKNVAEVIKNSVF